MSEAPLARVEDLRVKLLGLGFEERALHDLAMITMHEESSEVRAHAARILALWHTQIGQQKKCEKALYYLQLARRDAPDRRFQQTLVTIELQALAILRDSVGVHSCYRSAGLA
ncbi:hypothetical protein, partial [Histidinibacterium aquaticum]|uniref:hypothetical protein n=1 Tax=Histidinibacterium aquaticum TaxID=2613962 RepID=UPI001CC72381